MKRRYRELAAMRVASNDSVEEAEAGCKKVFGDHGTWSLPIVRTMMNVWDALHRSLQEAHYGHGDASVVAWNTHLLVKEVAWHLRPLPGFLGAIGGKHSFLVVTVGDQSISERYILERVIDHPQSVLLSDWADEGGHERIHVISVLKGSLKPGLSMQFLRDAFGRLDPYNVSTANCHHAALQVFNSCAKVEFQVPPAALPNRFLARVGGTFEGVGGSIGSSLPMPQKSQERCTASLKSRKEVSGSLRAERRSSSSLIFGRKGTVTQRLPSGFSNMCCTETAACKGSRIPELRSLLPRTTCI